MKTLFLDIDYTLVCADTPRPYLKQFFEYVSGKYNVVLFTANFYQRAMAFLEILENVLGKENKPLINKLHKTLLCRNNCNMVITNGGEYKCLLTATKKIRIPLNDDVIMLDDSPHPNNPHIKHFIQAEPFYGNLDDNYLLRIITDNIL